MNEPALDLGILLALVSSVRDYVIPDDVMVFGEVGRSGEVRAVSQAENRVQEAKRLGFHKVILPRANMNSCRRIEGIELVPVKAVREAIAESKK